jgi:hypothetical protein
MEIKIRFDSFHGFDGYDFLSDILEIEQRLNENKFYFGSGDDDYIEPNEEIDINFVKYIKLLESDKKFENKVKAIRSKFNLPEDGEPFQQVPSLIEKDLRRECDVVFEGFLLSHNVKEQLPEIIQYNCANGSNYFTFKVEKKNATNDYCSVVTIKVYSSEVSLNRVKSKLEENWNDIIKHVRNKKMRAFKLPPISDIEIWRLKNSTKMTYPEIAQYIGDKYHIDIDYKLAEARFSYIKKLYKRINPLYKLS